MATTTSSVAVAAGGDLPARHRRRRRSSNFAGEKDGCVFVCTSSQAMMFLTSSLLLLLAFLRKEVGCFQNMFWTLDDIQYFIHNQARDGYSWIADRLQIGVTLAFGLTRSDLCSETSYES